MPKPTWTLCLVALLLLLPACGKDEEPVTEPPVDENPPAVEQPRSPADVTKLVLEKKIDELADRIAEAETQLADVRANMKAIPESGRDGPEYAALKEEAIALENSLIDLNTQLTAKKQVLRNLDGPPK